MAFQGDLGNVFGTSCSSPIFASVIALINDRLIAAGRPVLGFLNPLYDLCLHIAILQRTTNCRICYQGYMHIRRRFSISPRAATLDVCLLFFTKFESRTLI